MSRPLTPWCLLALLLAASPAAAFVDVTRQEAAPRPAARPLGDVLDEGGGTERPETRRVFPATAPLSLHANRVFVTIRDQVAVTKVVHILQNDTDRILQARYRYPLGAAAHVTGYAIWEKHEKLVGELLDVREAERLYRTVTQQELTQREGPVQEVRAVRVARDPGILRQMSPDAFETHVYPILPWSLKQVELLYSEQVPAAAGWCTWSFPLEAARAFANPIGEVILELDLADTAGVRDVACELPGATVEQTEDGGYRVQFRAEEHAPAGPLVVRWRTGLAPSQAAVLAHRPTPAEPGYALVRVGLPEVAHPDAPLDVLLALDASGSACAAKRQRTLAALHDLLGALRPADRVGGLRFAERVEPGPALQPAGDAVRHALKAWLAERRPAGRTALGPALRAALRAGASEPGRRRLVVLATDGVTREDPAELLALEPTGARLLVVGTGHDDDVALLGALAERHGGALFIPGRGRRELLWPERPPELLRGPYGETVLDGDPGGLAGLLPEFRAAALTGVRLRDPGGDLQEVRALRPLTGLPGGGTACFLFRYDAPGPRTLELIANAGGRPYTTSFTVDLPAEEPAQRFVASWWARAEVAHLLRLEPADDEHSQRARIVELSLQHRFVTPFTAYLSLPDAERRRMLLGPMPPDDAADLYDFGGATPEAEVWLLILMGAGVVVLATRARSGRLPAPAAQPQPRPA